MSNIPAGLKTPGSYFDVNTNTQRTGLPANNHKVLFVVSPALIDEPIESPVTPDMPVSVYDKAQADAVFGNNNVAGRMITAAIKTNRTVDVQCLGKLMEGPM